MLIFCSLHPPFFAFACQIFTPKVSKKRVPVWRFDADDSQQQQQSLDTIDNHERQDNSASGLTSKLSGSKIWSFVSSILRYASLNSPNNLSMQETAVKDNESHVVIRRCASFAGMFHAYHTCFNKSI